MLIDSIHVIVDELIYFQKANITYDVAINQGFGNHSDISGFELDKLDLNREVPCMIWLPDRKLLLINRMWPQ